MSASDHRNAVAADTADRVTVGTVQREIRKGMSGAGVVAALGSPNIVTTDEAGHEVWVYDKVASEVVHSASALQLVPILLGSGGSLAGGAGGGLSHSAGATTRSTRSLTIVIKFDEQKRVRDFAYHATQF
ncbi:MAG: hypothetical protein HY736_06305 [Verrucomicrobia bacterium]|nr:hypothetical protein [Verrucomicrobiota bacterium]